MSNIIHCPKCGSGNVDCVAEPHHWHVCFDCGYDGTAGSSSLPHCATCNDEGAFHEERATSGGDIADVITGYCPDCAPVPAVEPAKDGET